MFVLHFGRLDDSWDAVEGVGGDAADRTQELRGSFWHEWVLAVDLVKRGTYESGGTAATESKSEGQNNHACQ